MREKIRSILQQIPSEEERKLVLDYFDRLKLENGTDHLTQVHNRKSFDRDLKKKLRISIRNPMSLILADIDHFKRVNDKYGHPAGDVVLSTFANYLQTNIRPGDEVYRYGGEEFIILAANASSPQGACLADRLRERILVPEKEILEKTGQRITLRASFGVVDTNEVKEELNSLKDLLKESRGRKEEKLESALEEIGRTLVWKADQALYFSKGRGRDMTSVYEEGEPHTFK